MFDRDDGWDYGKTNGDGRANQRLIGSRCVDKDKIHAKRDEGGFQGFVEHQSFAALASTSGSDAPDNRITGLRVTNQTESRFRRLALVP